MNAAASPYRGSEKHKNRPSRGGKGTLCPEWAHATPTGRLGNDPFSHDWAQTEAHRLFQHAVPHPAGLQKRYATKNGIAFEAKPTNDDTWHGYPIPWESVPASIVEQWLEQATVTSKQIKQHKRHRDGDIHWAMESTG